MQGKNLRIIGWIPPIVLLIMGALCFSGVMFRRDSVSQVQFGFFFSLVGVLWTIAMLRVQRAGSFTSAARKFGATGFLLWSAVGLTVFEGCNIAVL